MKEKRCVLCKKKFLGWGNNPYPLAKKGECCNECNLTKVIPARIKQYNKEKK